MANAFCFLCLKPSPGGGKRRGGSGQNIFWKFAREYLQISGVQDFFNGDECEAVKFCEDCDQVVGSISQLFLELKGIQLRLAWKLGELDKLLKSSEGSSSPEKATVAGVLTLAIQLGIGGDKAYRLARVWESLATKCAQKAREYGQKVIDPYHDVSFQEEIVVKSEPDAFTKLEGDEEFFGGDFNSNNDSGSDWAPNDDNDYSDNNQDRCNEERDLQLNPSEDRVSSTRKRKKKPKYNPFKREITIPRREKAEDGKSWDCELCGPTTSQKQLHLRGHEHAIEKKEAQCWFCYKVYGLQQSLEVHVKSCHPKNGHFVCQEEGCGGFQFESHLQLNEHLKTHLEDGGALHSCSTCGLGFLDVNLLKLHELLHVIPVKLPGHIKPRRVCPECGKDVINQACHLQNHYNLYHGAYIKTHKCSDCGTLCTSSHALWIHIQNHHKNKDKARRKKAARKLQLTGGPQSCQECGKEVKNKFQLDQHYLHIHKPVPCEVCREIFIGRSLLREHRIQAHKFKDNLNGEEGETFCCSICNKTFAKRIELVRHSSDFHGRAEFKCEVCQKTFKRRACLTIHKKSHGNDKDDDSVPYICPHCANTYSNQKYLDSHMHRTHPDLVTFSNEPRRGKDHQCPHCPEKKFRWKYALDRHIMQNHPGEEIAEGMLECNVCGMRMEQGKNAQMEYHMETHMSIEERRSQGKLHMCHVCGKEFRTRKAYKGHLKAHDVEGFKSTEASTC